LPINNTITGNAELNKVFEDFNVESYAFLGNFSWGDRGYRPAYEIRVAGGYSQMQKLCKELRWFFSHENIGTPNNVYYQTNIYFGILDPSVLPCSPTRSCNEEINSVFERYKVQSFKVAPGEGNPCVIEIIVDYSNVVKLYNALLYFNHLIYLPLIDVSPCYHSASPPIDIPPTNFLLGEGYSSCGINVADIEPQLPIISPNPVHDIVNISGIYPQQIILYDWQGREILTKTGYTDKINMMHFSKGLYFMRIVSDRGTVSVHKLVKQ
jgi:hypothetical protein